ncbi:uncharacterized protein ACA1_145810 [Acanthamoeba castellanii str. Neff]|uniref:Arrestin C-terminal-like domain-containing protein n=1 Tax=Acanthamoeba castellanii (strain ATCC 30010 / Neff) TaxID=1257118 RepID=L8GCX8_ACACF|nr:uncharacterized protein ACA1_145810 [Acanthamoeba castellanii str. Neff]ELR10927.1 hypothetical protein ACA1_145810 [Acanthamoeba castellanii str. Neff]
MDAKMLEARLDRVFRVMCSKLEAPMDSGQAALDRMGEEMQLNLPSKPFTVAKTEQGTVILNLMYKADKLLASLTAIEEALIKRKEEGLKKADKPSWRRRSVYIPPGGGGGGGQHRGRASSINQLPDLPQPQAGLAFRSNSYNLSPQPPLQSILTSCRVASHGRRRKSVSMAEANRLAQMSIRRHMGHPVPEPDAGLSNAPTEEQTQRCPILRLETAAAEKEKQEEEEPMGRTNLVVNYTRHGLAAIDEQKRVKKVPKKASTMVILVAKSPRKRFYVGDNIPVELEIRNHTMQVIKEIAMSLCHVTYGAVMGYRADDQEKKQKTKLRVEKKKEAVRTEVMTPFGFPIKGKFRSTHHVRFKIPFSSPPSVVLPDVLPDALEHTETFYMLQIRVGGPKFGGPIMSLGPFKLEPRPSMQ